MTSALLSDQPSWFGKITRWEVVSAAIYFSLDSEQKTNMARNTATMGVIQKKQKVSEDEEEGVCTEEMNLSRSFGITYL